MDYKQRTSVHANSSTSKTRQKHLIEHLISKGFSLGQSGKLVGLFISKSSHSVTSNALYPHKSGGINNYDVDPVILELDKKWLDEYITTKDIKPKKALF